MLRLKRRLMFILKKGSKSINVKFSLFFENILKVEKKKKKKKKTRKSEALMRGRREEGEGLLSTDQMEMGLCVGGGGGGEG